MKNLNALLTLALISFSHSASAGGGVVSLDLPIEVSPTAHCQGKNVSFSSFKLLKAPFVYLATGVAQGQKIQEIVAIAYVPDEWGISIMPYDPETNSYSVEWTLFNNPDKNNKFSFGKYNPVHNEQDIIDDSVRCYGIQLI